MNASRKTGWRNIFSSRGAKSGNRKRCKPHGLSFESLEERQMFAGINWVNEGDVPNGDNFKAVFGANAQLARDIVHRAMSDWADVIDNFTYAGKNDNTFDLWVDARDFSMMDKDAGNDDLIADGTPTRLNNGKPEQGHIRLNTRAQHWLDGTPQDDVEFVGPTNAFTGFNRTSAGTDFYATVLHELGHALGFSTSDHAGNSTLLKNLLKDTGVDDPSTTDPGNLFTFNVGRTRATFTDADPGHLWAGAGFTPHHKTPWSELPTHNDALMNPGSDIYANERNLISDLEASILRDAYGYSVNMPSTFANMYVNWDSTNHVLNVVGGSGKSHDSVTVDTAPGGFIKVTVNGYSELVQASMVSRIDINTGDGTDLIHLYNTGNKPTSVTGGYGEDDLQLYRMSNATINGRTINASHLSDVTANVEYLTIWGTNGADTLNIETFSQFTDLTARMGDGNDTFNIATKWPYGVPAFTTPMFLYGDAGNDTLNIGGGTANVLAATVTFDGGDHYYSLLGKTGGDRIQFNDSLIGYDVEYDIEAGSIARKTATNTSRVTYKNVEGIQIDGGSAVETFSIGQGVTASVNARGNGGNDIFSVGGGLLGAVGHVLGPAGSTAEGKGKHPWPGRGW
jgi:hypothetical protein